MNRKQKRKDLTGQRFNRWNVVSFSHVDKKQRSAYWNCICICGTKSVVAARNLKNGDSRSCGCLQKDAVSRAHKIHGQSGGRNERTRVYRIWTCMKYRCTNKNNSNYKYYGDRGITVCKRWVNSFNSFISDMGMPTSNKHSIERINNNLGYYPSNCKWATQSEQLRNRRKLNRAIGDKAVNKIRGT